MMKTNPGIALRVYRISRFFYKHNLKILSKIFYYLNYILFSCSIPASAILEKNVILPHSIGIVIHPNSVIGEGTIIYQNVTIGNANGPIIGKNCIIGTGACILGDIKIEDNCKIGANAVVLNDIPKDATVVGVPGKIIKIKGKKINEKKV